MARVREKVIAPADPPAPPSPSTSKLLRYIAQLVVVAIYKSLTTVSTPLAGIIAFYIWCGRGALNLVKVAQRLLLRGIGWLSCSAFSPDNWLRVWARHNANFNIKRWHITVGKSSLPECGWLPSTACSIHQKLLGGK